MHTHRLTMDADVVRKQFVSWSRGEADREWTGLVTLSRHAPGLVPEPLERYLQPGGAPVIVMSRLPGTPLGASRLSLAQVRALAVALRRLFAVPAGRELPERALGASTMRAQVRGDLAADPQLSACRDPALVAQALALAREWLTLADSLDDGSADTVPALGDGNLGNVLWDGTRCRLVDFEEFGISSVAYEVADLVEHVSSRLRRLLDVDLLLEELHLDARERARLTDCRRLLAIFWLVMLLPGNRGFRRNPAGCTEDQADHVIGLLNA
ncbi:phosphotransferase [Nocardioides mesophilus]|uniref:Aminoglycoside phosphotransferase family protein n=1 Tax=Nocardioides mesophilus TaxID=433659 RepID=A0A7G9RFR7_9ACTN|nr:phosphotransferase [Nocardioides mesophilus]QNN54442.1 aminoglycoside phosphotransferase family protein [Nocardioides mesophilus]